MVLQIKQRLTLQEFETFINQPDNSDKIFEFIDGEIIEVPSNPYASKIAAKILTYIGMYLIENDIGHVTGVDGGYMVGGECYAPDVAYISYDRQEELAQKGYNPNPPELAVEVISDPTNSEEQRKLRLKLSSYLATGMTVWVVNSQDRRVEIHRVGEISQELDEAGILTIDDILPQFRLAVKDIFPIKK
jgi:Uma2 family endonuclease